MLMLSDWRAVEVFAKFKERSKMLFKLWFICLVVLAILVPGYAQLTAQGYNFSWLVALIKGVGFPFLFFLSCWCFFVSVLIVGTWRIDYWRTYELRKALIPPLPGNSPDDRGAQMVARFNRVKKWAKSAYVVSYGTSIKFIVVHVPDSVFDDEEFERFLTFGARRIAQSAQMRYGTWEDMTIGRLHTKHYKFLVLRKN